MGREMGGRFKREGISGTPLQSSHLENSMDGGAWWAAVHGHKRPADTSTRSLKDPVFPWHRGTSGHRAGAGTGVKDTA